MRTFTSANDILAAIGEELGTSSYLTITQERVNTFADATGDHQWIHVDPERAAAESPYGGPIAHGYLTLSLLPLLMSEIYTFDNAKLAINYGSNKIRFPAPVPVGAEISLTATLTSAELVSEGTVELVVTQVITAKNAEKPSLVAQTVSRVVF